jgi:putative FmdB family regulatory protein
MPIYEYECSSCHCRFERKQRFDEEPVAMCPKCKEKARRVIHSVPVIFKGSGFYITDNRKGVSGPVETEKKLPDKGKHK